MDTLRVLLITLLGLCLLAPAAGAIYIEGQTIPDDGMYHILSADAGAGETAPAAVSGDDDLPAGVLPGYVWDDTPGAGLAGLTGGFPVMLVPDPLPMLSIPSEEAILTPSTALPSSGIHPADSAVIGSPVMLPMSGFSDFFDAGSLLTNMPALNGLFF